MQTGKRTGTTLLRKCWPMLRYPQISASLIFAHVLTALSSGSVTARVTYKAHISSTSEAYVIP